MTCIARHQHMPSTRGDSTPTCSEDAHLGDPLQRAVPTEHCVVFPVLPRHQHQPRPAFNGSQRLAGGPWNIPSQREPRRSAGTLSPSTPRLQARPTRAGACAEWGCVSSGCLQSVPAAWGCRLQHPLAPPPPPSIAAAAKADGQHVEGSASAADVCASGGGAHCWGQTSAGGADRGATPGAHCRVAATQPPAHASAAAAPARTLLVSSACRLLPFIRPRATGEVAK